ncbi:hypothetical protein [Candidatus Thiodictyon syntrophicum]|jgi:hypothetical protein|uniref:Uncharacterized protein n=1 Tax=Candidatus Thiodictyon syntrophicum TaxID=1166950 RepID=A0A2K8U5E4_9GAMM|nr:hypothetical protein [Candidatus Thiodictyon syntrophicum]AUB80804.1 hypothetical protein THSYN_07450 [Candidatus Thiodictyon syntrophicum]
MAIEFDWDEDPGNPYYHQIGDTAATLNYPFALEVSRGAAATVIDLAGLMGVPAPPVWVLLVPGLVLLRRWSRPGIRRTSRGSGPGPGLPGPPGGRPGIRRRP